MKTWIRVAAVVLAGTCLAAGMSCSKKNPVAIPTNYVNPNALYQVYIMGVPMLHQDFNTSGRFNLAVIGLTLNENVFWASASNATVATTCTTGTYTGAIESIAKVIPTLSKIAVQMIFDGSGSMSWNDPGGVRKAAGTIFISKLNRRNPLHKVAVAEFGRDSPLDFYFHLWQDFTLVADSASFSSTFQQLSEDGATPFYTAVRRGLEHMDSTISPSECNRAILALTDGVENSSHYQDTVNGGYNVYTLARNRNIPIYIVGLGTDIDLNGMVRMSSYSSGVYAQANVANDLKGIYAVIGASLSQGYNLLTCTVSPVPPSGKQLKFTIRLKDGDKLVAKDVWFQIP
ncbi:MAG: vWA domain-containing protein [Candidatus Edwardsbacteria bacterium]|nr:vWA domain-containing protein [Candidatus Edwardsbacteria bacterium]